MYGSTWKCGELMCLYVFASICPKIKKRYCLGISGARDTQDLSPPTDLKATSTSTIPLFLLLRYLVQSYYSNHVTRVLQYYPKIWPSTSCSAWRRLPRSCYWTKQQWWTLVRVYQVSMACASMSRMQTSFCTDTRSIGKGGRVSVGFQV